MPRPVGCPDPSVLGPIPTGWCPREGEARLIPGAVCSTLNACCSILGDCAIPGGVCAIPDGVGALLKCCPGTLGRGIIGLLIDGD